jgi:anti-sigma B factor antagonist
MPIDLSLEASGNATCAIVGDLDGSATEALNSALDEALAAGSNSLTFDFSSAEYINSSGIGAIIGVLRTARDAGVSLKGVGLSDHYKHIFEITRLSDFIEIQNSTEGSGGRQDG